MNNSLLETTSPFSRETPMHGDMPGDKVEINDTHREKAARILPILLEKLGPVCEANPSHRAVICVCGGSGVGKSEIASLLGQALQDRGLGSYVLSGDNYPHRIPAQNDAERLRVFRCGAWKGLLTSGLYTPQVKEQLLDLQRRDLDCDSAQAAQAPWLAAYQREGKKALVGYLGSNKEQDFDELSHIIRCFKNGDTQIYLKRMGRTPLDLWYDAVDFSHKQILIVEWTHGNSDYFAGVDIPILLNSTPQETLEHRRSRNRDGGVDHPFTTMVLEIEQRMLESNAHKAAIIVAKNGDLLSYAQYRALMA